MKKIKIEKRLSLSKETIANLNNNQLNSVKGGGTADCAPNTAPCTTETYPNTNCTCAGTRVNCDTAYVTC